MTRIAVTDANIFIDLIILELIQHLFVIDFEIHTTKEVYDQLHAGQKMIIDGFLLSGSLRLYKFSAEEIIEIGELDFPKGLEPADRTVFYYAKKFSTQVLSGDQKLKKYCESKGLAVSGIIWIFDKLVESTMITPAEATKKLERLIAYNDRLPMEEISKRIRKWK